MVCEKNIVMEIISVLLIGGSIRSNNHMVHDHDTPIVIQWPR